MSDEAKKTNKKSVRQISFRVTEEEYTALGINAERAGLSIPAYVKKVGLKAKVRPQLIDKEVGRAIYPHIAKSGANLNQIARKLNQGQGIEPGELDKAMEGYNIVVDWLTSGAKPKKEQPAQADEPSIGFDFAEPEEEPEPENESITPVNMPQFTDVSAIPQEDQAKPLVCTSCGEAISEGVYDYSMKYHGRPLCISCQK